MIAICTKCGGAFETCEEDACAPGTLCLGCYKASQTRAVAASTNPRTPDEIDATMGTCRSNLRLIQTQLQTTLPHVRSMVSTHGQRASNTANGHVVHTILREIAHDVLNTLDAMSKSYAPKPVGSLIDKTA